ncbi:MAG TPA: hypothetical protein VGJ15_11240 [Pirellulales bacterium]
MPATPQIDRDVIEYHRLCAWSPVALVLGIVSGAAIIGPMLWFIPAAGIVAGLVALKKISASQGQVSGWNVAVLGLAMSLFFGVAGPARTLSRQYWLATRAEIVAHEFVDDLVNNKPFAAHQLTRPAGNRLPNGAAPPEPYAKDEHGKKDYDAFLATAPVKALLADGPHAKIDWQSCSFVGTDDHGDYLDVHYRISFPGVAGGQSMEVHSVVERSLAYDTQAEQWRIVGPGIQMRKD